MGKKFVADPAIAKANLTEALETLKAGMASLDNVQTFTRHLAALGRGNLARYSVNNQILILVARPGATEVGGFKYWIGKGRTPLKGRGVRILAPAIFTKTREVENDETGETETVDVLIRRFRCVTVWDIQDTDGPAVAGPATTTEFLPAEAGALPFSTGPEAEEIARDLDSRLCAALASAYHCPVTEDARPGVYGSFYPAANRIAINRSFDAVSNCATVAHEGAHCVVHHTPDLAGGGYDVEEQVAEGSAFALLMREGLRTDRFSFSYIKGYHGNAKSVAALLGRISKVVNALVVAMGDESQEEVAA